MGRKKGGKNPEGHKAGGARMGAGRPRKAGPLTLKAAIRVHAHHPTDPTILIRRDMIHPALQALLDIPASYTLRCCNCGHSDPTNLLESSPPSAAEENPATTPNLFSRSQSPGLGEPLSAVSVDFGHRDDTSSLFTPPQSVSPGGSSISDPDHLHSALSTDESVVSHAESLLMLNTTAPSITIPTMHQAYELDAQEMTPSASHPHSHLSVMQPNHITQSPITYNNQPQHTLPQQQLDSTGPEQFLPTGQHTQRRRRRCVICIGAGRGEEADRCCGRGNRHLCPLYSKHGSLVAHGTTVQREEATVDFVSTMVVIGGTNP